jgi:2-polyprenyl-3-methyl-5-hydroxy-6-metoxy-1,4-benzoquinol methylase
MTDWYHEARRPEMLAFVPENARRILELGCSKGVFGEQVKARQPVEYVGIDGDADCVAAAGTRLDRALRIDLDGDWPSDLGSFDCIVCNDVLEHLRDPWSAVRRLRDLLVPGGCVVASIPNVRHFEVVKELLLHRRWRYTASGVLDRTHLRFFTESTVRALFEQGGLEVVRLEGINGEPFPWKFGLLNRVLLNAFDDMRWLQFGCLARRPAAA